MTVHRWFRTFVLPVAVLLPLSGDVTGGWWRPVCACVCLHSLPASVCLKELATSPAVCVPPCICVRTCVCVFVPAICQWMCFTWQPHVCVTLLWKSPCIVEPSQHLCMCQPMGPGEIGWCMGVTVGVRRACCWAAPAWKLCPGHWPVAPHPHMCGTRYWHEAAPIWSCLRPPDVTME